MEASEIPLIISEGEDYVTDVATKLRLKQERARGKVVSSWRTGGRFTSQKQKFYDWAASSDLLFHLDTEEWMSEPLQVPVERADTEKMQMLYELAPSWDTWCKDQLYLALNATNPALVEELEGGHFVEWHQEKLISEASLVDEVLALLYGDVLDHEQYLEICTEPGKMRKLYELVLSWDVRRKDWLYQALKATNRVLVEKLEVSPSPRDHFVEHYRKQLIQRVSSVDRVLSLLQGDVLNNEQYRSILAEGSDPERMAKLYELVPCWNRGHKGQLYWALTLTNRALIKELEGAYFIEQHRVQLIQQVSKVDKVLVWLSRDVLGDKQAQSIRTDPMRMRKLYELVPSWEMWRKDRLYQALKVTDKALVRELEDAASSDQESFAVTTSAGATGEHFVEQHRQQLIKQVSSVDQVLDLLRSDVLEPEAYRSIKIYPETMRKLYDLVQTRDRRLKDRLYEALNETNRALVEELEGEHFVDRHREQLIQRVSNVDEILERFLPHGSIITEDSGSEKMLKLYKLVPSWNRKRKDRLWKWLKETNRALVEELEGEHFVDRHREQLIQRVSNVGTLCRRVLRRAQYRGIVTDPEKMRKLYELVPSWDAGHKDRLYQALKETNPALVNELDGKHVVEQIQEQLIHRVSKVTQVLHLLCGTVLSWEQYQKIQSERRNLESVQKVPNLLVGSQNSEHQDQAYQTQTAANKARAGELKGAQKLKKPQMSTVERTDLEKMWKLYELVSGWDTWCKDQLYSALKATNPALVEELEGGHFVEWHREELVKRVSLVDEVLALVYGDVLDHEQYLEICTEPGKMRKLYELVPSWDTEHKDRLYLVLKETNRVLVEELEVSPSPRDHFVERHREQLIQRVSSVDRAVSLLCRDVLNYEQYQSIMMEVSDVERMAKLYELVPSWDRERKDFLYRVLRLTNPALTEELEASTLLGDHFVERHREQLIQRVSPVDTVLRLLRRSVLDVYQYNSILEEGPDPKRMRKLYESVPCCDVLDRDRLYHVLAETNPALIKELEGDHFVERHHVQLIWRVSRVDEILARLGRDVLGDEQSQSIRTDPVRMRKLYKLVPSWETWRKDRLYQALKVTDGALVQELDGAGGSEQGPSASTSTGITGEHFVEQHREQLIKRVSSVDQVLDLLRRDVLEPEAYRSIRIYPETMRKLYDLVQTWDRRLKDRLYEALNETNRALVKN